MIEEVHLQIDSRFYLYSSGGPTTMGIVFHSIKWHKADHSISLSIVKADLPHHLARVLSIVD